MNGLARPMRRTTRRLHRSVYFSRGMTLVELLVSMVILGFVMSLVSQAVFQVGLVTRAADDASRLLGSRWAQGWALSASFANLVVPSEAQDTAFTGDNFELQGFSTVAVDGQALGVAPLDLSLRQTNIAVAPGRPADEQTELWAAFPIRNGANERRRVAVFQGRAQFAYRDRLGVWSDRWPAPFRVEREPKEVLPAAVMIREAAGSTVLIAYPVPASEARQQPQLRSPFGS